MATFALAITQGTLLGNGKYGLSIAGTADLLAASDDVDTAQTAAEENATIAGDGTALGLVQDIATAYAPVKAALGADMLLLIDTATVTTRNALVQMLEAAVRELQNYGKV